MKIGIDVSQLTYRNTGVANYLQNFVESLLKKGSENEYILFFSSLRGSLDKDFISGLKSSRVVVKEFRFPPTILDIVWNKLHIMPIEWFVGDVDVFITSDWTEPPTKKAKKATILYDLIVYQYPKESTPTIVKTQKRKLAWVKKEAQAIFCISQATKNDAENILGIAKDKLHVIYPGVTL
ncbi:MAG TPA: glycosyltransferase [Patescibacteria group bacterium]|nr:glycosyltransferase [Patescibacteria group bacterium]